MKLPRIVVTLVVTLALFATVVARAQQAPASERPPTYQELLELVRRLETTVGQQGQQIASNQAEIARLRAALAAATPAPGDGDRPLVDLAEDPAVTATTEAGAATPRKKPKRVDVESERKGLLSLRLGGRLEVEWVDTERERSSPADATDLPEGHFQIDKLKLTLDARATENIHAFANLDFGGDGGVGLDEAYIELDNLPLDARLSAGKRRRFIEMSRRIESYPLLGTAFWRSRETGLQGRFDVGDLRFHGSLTNGMSLRGRPPGEDAAFPFLADGPRNFDLGHAKELGLGLEYDLDLGKKTDLEVMAFAYFGRLDDDELALLDLIEPSTPSEDRDRSLYGFNLDFDWRGFELQGQLISADEGANLDRLGWTLQPSWEIELPGVDAFGSRWLTAVRPLFRYSALRSDLEARADDSLTWNRTAYTAAVALDLTDHTSLFIEQTWNHEQPHRFGVRNDEFLIHLRLSW